MVDTHQYTVYSQYNEYLLNGMKNWLETQNVGSTTVLSDITIILPILLLDNTYRS